MGRNFRIIKSCVCTFFISISLLGCSNQNENHKSEQDTQQNNYELKFIKNDDIEIMKLNSIEKLQSETKGSFSVTSSYGHIYLYEYFRDRENGLDTIKSVYSCDVENDETTKLKSFDDKFVVSFTEFNDSYVYAYLEDTRLKIVQEKNGTIKNIAEANVYNRFLYTPQFFVYDDQLLFILTDTKIESEKAEVHIHQSLLSYKNDNLTTLYESAFTVLDNQVETEAKQILSNEFQIQGNGKMMFEVRSEDSITLFKYDKGELSEVTLNYPNYYLVGYLGDNALFFDKNTEGYILFNLESEQSIDIDYTDAMYYPKIYNSTVIFFNDRKNKLWSISLDENNNYRLTDMNTIIFDKMDLDYTVDRMNFVFSDGNNILLTQSNPESESYYTFYKITYSD